MSWSVSRGIAGAGARVALLGTLLGVALPAAVAGEPASSRPCVAGVRALDAAGHPLFESIAAVLDREGLAALPLHPLERGGARWQRLEITLPGSAAAAVTSVLAVDAAANLALVEAPGLDACAPAPEAAEAAEPVAGSAIRVARPRSGYRSATIGGHVERVVTLAGGGRVVLVRLLDDGGADPGLVHDAGGRFLGATLPAPPAGQPALAAFAPWYGHGGAAPGPGAAGGGGDADPRAAVPAQDAPSAMATDAGLVAQALLAAGPDAAERGIALLQEVVRHGGESASLLVERGVLQFKAGRLAPAIADFDRAVALDPASHVARFNLGIALGTSGRYADAATALRAARDLNPTHARTRYQLALALKAARMADEARRECASLEALDPHLAGELRSLIGS